MTGPGPAADAPDEGPLVVVSGEVTPEEVAALTAVVAALGAAQATAVSEPTSAPVSQWAARSRQLRGGHTPGRGGWRASALPR